MPETILAVQDVSIRYMTGDFKDIGLKEYLLRRIKKDYQVKEFWADKNISFTLEKGDMLGIVGTNGAGKSTLLKVVSGIMEPTMGKVRRNGNVVALLELGSGFDGDLTVKENAYLRGAMLGYTRSFMNEVYDQIISFAELKEFENRPFKQLSSGMKSRLAFSIASMVFPEILILDEVLSVGDGAFKKKSEAKMKEIIRQGATTILVSHSIRQVREMCNKVLWLHRGEQIEYGYDVKGICDRYEAMLEGKYVLSHKNPSPKVSKKRLVELMGPSGVGKSTILQHAMTQHACEWITPEEIPYEFFFSDKKQFQQAVRNYIDNSISDFIEATYQMIIQSTMTPSQKLKALKTIQTTAEKRVLSNYAMEKGYLVVCDELFLHRAFSFLMYSNNLEEDTRRYFATVPVPSAVAIIMADPKKILERIAERQGAVNCYYEKNEKEIFELVQKGLKICSIANEELASRGVRVTRIKSDQAVNDSASMLNQFIIECFKNEQNDTTLKSKSIFPRLQSTSKSFKKKTGRHVMSNPEVMYCSFCTPRFVVHVSEAERDSLKRLRKFGISKALFEGKRVLDLGCNAGAMLFQAANMDISYGLGIEYDIEKVNVAEEIRTLSHINNIEFRQADIDMLHGKDVGKFDIVFCLAIIAHVMDEDHLFQLLGEVTQQSLYFEGNANTDIDMVCGRLKQLGFKQIKRLGVCNDDIRAKNNNRPIIFASRT